MPVCSRVTMRPISILFTNNTLGMRAGTEHYVRDVALGLLRRGHKPVAFSLLLGEVADELRRATVPVVDDLTRVGEPPDVIHGHHHFETLIAALTFPGTPVVNFCHGWVPWEEMPLHHPAVRRYVAVDEACVDRLVRVEGIAPSRVELLLNFIDLDRFRPRAPLSAGPTRALVLSNSATPANYAGVIVSACRVAGIAVDIVGHAAGNPTSAPETLMASYDLVFAKGRTVLEALAVGCAVVLADAAGAGPLVTPANYDALRARNFGIRELTQPHDVAWYGAQIARYRASDAAAVAARVRTEAGMEPAIDRLLDIYAAAMTLPPGPGDPALAAARHCCRIAAPLKRAYEEARRAGELAADLLTAREEMAALARTAGDGEQQAAAAAIRSESQLVMAQHAVIELEHQLAAAHGAVNERESQLAAARRAAMDLERQVAAYRALPALRLRDVLVKWPVVGPVLQKSARRLAKLLP